MSKILTDKQILELERFLSWHEIPDHMLNWSVNDLYKYMIEKKGTFKNGKCKCK